MCATSPELGLTISFSTPPSEAVAQAVCAERLGFKSVWIGEHYLRPVFLESRYPYSSSNAPLSARESCHDSMAIAAAIAASTSRLRIATGIYLFPLQHPLVVARSASTIQSLSGGRFILGAAAGWAKEEYEALGIPFEARGRRMDEGLTVFRKALAGGDFEHQGSHYSLKAMSLLTAPMPVPIVIGGSSEPALRRAARFGDGWLTTPGLSVDECVAMQTRLLAMRQDFGVVGGEFRTYVRAPSASPADIRRYLGAGLNSIIVGGRQVMNPADPLDRKLASLEAIAFGLGLVPAGS